MPFRTAQNSVLRGQRPTPESCLLTWYDPALGGINTTGAANPYAKTASGEPYNPNAYTCAAPPAYPFGTIITFMYNGITCSCKVNDRGGAIQGSHFDLSRAAANKLGIISAGHATAQFVVGGIAGTPDQSTTAGNAMANQVNQPDKGATLDFGGFFSLAAGDVATFVFDAFIKFPVLLVVDYAVIPFWHWNQRAVMNYQTTMLDDTSGLKTLATLVFWGAGYGLLWGDPDARNVKDFFRRGVDPNRTHMSRHLRTLQSLKAKRELIKPKDVKKATLEKPPPQYSAARVQQVGTMSTTRPHRVTVHGYRADERTQTANGGQESRRISLRDRIAENPTTSSAKPKTRESDSSDRTGVGSQQAGRRDSQGSQQENRPRRRGVPRK